jgi:hypothetical protein
MYYWKTQFSQEKPLGPFPCLDNALNSAKRSLVIGESKDIVVYKCKNDFDSPVSLRYYIENIGEKIICKLLKGC